ncbi:BMA_0021/BMA_0022 family TOMM bacteriocin [Sorangium sp. So ce1151]|uniref:BMA_0021/BMA_0022 family TOMM bacteriocin n=1 Tax=Sorangium sp. So ce1151 TaxID=3133332 RepID=UPI003F5E09EA
MFFRESSKYRSGTSDTSSTPAQLDGGPVETGPSRGGAAMDDGLLELETAWLRAIALSWEDPAQLERLKRDPREFLSTQCGYALPPGIELTVRDAWDPGSPSGGAWRFCEQRKGWDLSPGAITLHVPPPPPLEDQPVALAELAGDMLPPVCVC